MKRIIYFLIFVSLCTLPLFADRVVAPSSLPKKAQKLLATSFPAAQITYVEKDDGEYQVKLSDGTEAVFSWTGNWKKFDSQLSPLPDSLIPPPVLHTIKTAYAGASIMYIEKEWNRFEVQLVNRLELFFNSKGELLGRKYDD